MKYLAKVFRANETYLEVCSGHAHKTALWVRHRRSGDGDWVARRQHGCRVKIEVLFLSYRARHTLDICTRHVLKKRLGKAQVHPIVTP